ncbi:MAG: hypothetical protein V7641_2290 [Blastocatellia bacterium]
MMECEKSAVIFEVKLKAILLAFPFSLAMTTMMMQEPART